MMAYRREGFLDHSLTIFASVVSSIPNYLIGILLVVWLGVQWKICPLPRCAARCRRGDAFCFAGLSG
jgi:ABC-type dipeptide/oligopeptide/nickel transport system permease component